MSTTQFSVAFVLALANVAGMAYAIRTMEQTRGKDFVVSLACAVGHFLLALWFGLVVALEVVRWA